MGIFGGGGASVSGPAPQDLMAMLPSSEGIFNTGGAGFGTTINPNSIWENAAQAGQGGGQVPPLVQMMEWSQAQHQQNQQRQRSRGRKVYDNAGKEFMFTPGGPFGWGG